MTHLSRDPETSGSLPRSTPLDDDGFAPDVITIESDEPILDEIARIASSQIARAIDAIGRSRPHVHTARKALKRTRGVLRLVRKPLGDTYRRANATLRDAGKLLAPARDAEVTVETFDAVVATLRERPEDVAKLRQALVDLEGAVFGELAAPDGSLEIATAMLESEYREWSDFDGGPRTDAPGDLIEPGLRRTYRRARTALSGVGSSHDPETYHRWRKDVKYLRYQLEALTDVASVPADVIGDLDALGDLLGSEQDLVVLDGALADLDADPESAATPIREALARQIEPMQDAAVELGKPLFTPRPREFTTTILRRT